MKVALELTRQENGQQAVLVTVEGDGRHDAANWSPAPDLSIQHRDGNDESWVEVATIPWQPALTYLHIDDFGAYVRCVAPTCATEENGGSDGH